MPSTLIVTGASGLGAGSFTTESFLTLNSMSRDPCRDENTTCTAVAADFVFTVRT